MLKRIKELFGGGPDQIAATPPATEVVLDPEVAADALSRNSESQELRLELAERDRLIATLKDDLERMRNAEAERIAELLHAHMQKLMADLAAPVAQIVTQTHLFEVEQKPLQSKMSWRSPRGL